MKFMPVKEIPKAKRRGSTGHWHRLNTEIEDFIRGDQKMVMVVFDESEYANPRSFYFSMRNAVARVPGGDKVKVLKRGDTLYLKKV